MLIVFYVLLVWLKIIVGTTIVLLWLWFVRDRGLRGPVAALHTGGALLLWAAPWIAFLWIQSHLYQGHCGLRQGIHECGLPEFLWTQLRWVRLGLVLDVMLLVGVLMLVWKARVSLEESRRFLLSRRQA